MSILFKGVEMPKGCWDCPFQTNPICATNDILNFTTRIARPDNCPLTEVSEDAQPVVYGKNLDRETPSIFTCSVCGWHSWDTYCGDTSEYNYCPNCGARMDGGT